jgi:hypothetical protein
MVGPHRSPRALLAGALLAALSGCAERAPLEPLPVEPAYAPGGHPGFPLVVAARQVVHQLRKA